MYDLHLLFVGQALVPSKFGLPYCSFKVLIILLNSSRGTEFSIHYIMRKYLINRIETLKFSIYYIMRKHLIYL